MLPKVHRGVSTNIVYVGLALAWLNWSKDVVMISHAAEMRTMNVQMCGVQRQMHLSPLHHLPRNVCGCSHKLSQLEIWAKEGKKPGKLI